MTIANFIFIWSYLRCESVTTLCSHLLHTLLYHTHILVIKMSFTFSKACNVVSQEKWVIVFANMGYVWRIKLKRSSTFPFQPSFITDYKGNVTGLFISIKIIRYSFDVCYKYCKISDFKSQLLFRNLNVITTKFSILNPNIFEPTDCPLSLISLLKNTCNASLSRKQEIVLYL